MKHARPHPLSVAAARLLAAGLALVLGAGAAVADEDPEEIVGLSLEELLEVDVTTASKRSESVLDAPGVVTVLTRRQIRAFDGRNLGEVVAKVASTVFLSANVVTDNLVVVRKQALTPYNTHVLILLDGRPLRDPVGGGLNSSVWATFPVDAIEQIEVVRGPGSVLYGSGAYSGVINIRTRIGSLQDAGQASFEVGSWQAFGQAATVVHRREDGEVLVSLFHRESDGPRYRFTDYAGTDSTVRWGRESTGLLATARSGGVRGAFYLGDFRPYALSGATNTFLPVEDYDNGRNRTLFTDLGWAGRVSNRWRGSFNFTYNNHQWFNRADDLLDIWKLEASDYLGEATLHGSLGGATSVVVGGTVQRSVFHSDLLIDGEETAFTLYAQADRPLWPWLKAIVGLQYNDPEHGASNLSPRLGLVLRSGGGLGGKLLYSQAFRSGSRLEESFDLPTFRGNLELAPEIIDTFEAQVFHRTERAQAQATAYFSRMSDIIFRRRVEDPGVPTGFYIVHDNGGSHDFWGVEVEGKARLRGGWLLTGNASWMQDEDDQDRRNYTLHSEWMVKVGVAWQGEAADLGLFHAHYGDPGEVAEFDPTVAAVNPPAEAYGLLSAQLRLRSGRLLGREEEGPELTLWAENLLDEDVRYPEYTSRGINTLTPLRGGRSFHASLGWRF